jgi:hypothetical protein
MTTKHNIMINEKCKQERIGETVVNKCGYKMKIIDYINSANVIVEFENGYVAKCTYFDFKKGGVRNKTGRIGEIKENTYGSKMEIIEYKKFSDITVKFENGYLIRTNYDSFNKGLVLNPYDRTVFGTGYLGEGDYKGMVDGILTDQYLRWKGVLDRCCDLKFKEKKPTYIDVTVCEEWHNFQNFAKWYDENYYEIEGEKMELDKDILFKGNKLYSPDTCIFTPRIINTLFVKNDKDRTDLPIGVNRRGLNSYSARCGNGFEKDINLGTFKTVESAFYAYKQCKEEVIQAYADKYKNKIPLKLYEAMYNYKVEIDD